MILLSSRTRLLLNRDVGTFRLQLKLLWSALQDVGRCNALSAHVGSSLFVTRIGDFIRENDTQIYTSKQSNTSVHATTWRQICDFLAFRVEATGKSGEWYDHF
jgi:hypothetical protein